VTLLIPVSAILLGALFLEEQFAATDFAGMVLIGLGLLGIDGRLAARIRLSCKRGKGNLRFFVSRCPIPCNSLSTSKVRR